MLVKKIPVDKELIVSTLLAIEKSMLDDPVDGSLRMAVKIWADMTSLRRFDLEWSFATEEEQSLRARVEKLLKGNLESSCQKVE